MSVLQSNNIPNFFIVGAPRAGTTFLYNIIKQHPDIFMSPIKEPHYFCDAKSCGPTIVIKDPQKYLDLFKKVNTEKIIGEASTSYLFFEKTAKRIRVFNPNSKILILLRDPSERAYSHYLMDKEKYATEDKDFIDAIDLNYFGRYGFHGTNINPYIIPSLYYKQIKNYLDVFGHKQVKVFFLDDLKKDINKYIKELFNFLGVKHLPKIEIQNDMNTYIKTDFTKTVKLLQSEKFVYIKRYFPQRIKKIIKKNIIYKKSERPILSNHVRKIMVEKYFKNDVMNLQNLINKDLSNWLKISV